MRKVCMLLLACVVYSSFSQTYRLKGRVVDDSKNPIEFVNVLLLNSPDSSYVAGDVSKETGEFVFSSLNRGDYILKLSIIGYENISISVSLTNNRELSDIVLSDASVSLNEVVLTSARPIIRREIDRVVFDVEASPALQGTNGLEVLRRTPGLLLENNGLSIIGKGGVIVLINDRETKMSGDELMDLLRTYRSEEIAGVEVITTPPAKYQAEGNSGIINIRLKKARKEYIGGSVSASRSFSEYSSNYVSVNLNFNNKRVSAFLNLTGGFGEFGYLETYERLFPTQVWRSRWDTKAKNNNLSYRGGVDYELDNNYTIGVHVSGSNKVGNRNIHNESVIRMSGYNTDVIDSLLVSKGVNRSPREQLNVNVHLDKVFDEQGKKMAFDVDYLNYKRGENYDFNSMTTTPQNEVISGSIFGYNRDSERNLKAVTSSLDFTLPFSSFTLTTGARYSLANTDYYAYYYDGEIPEQYNDFTYKENIGALYVDAMKEFSKKVTLKLGLRGEYTNTKGISGNNEHTENYFKLFPTFYFLYRPQADHALNMTFSNRISRPAYNMVDPFITYQNKYTSFTGKADLKPSYSYNAEIGYTFRNNLSANVFYSYLTDGIGQLSDTDVETSSTFTMWDNFYKEHKGGFNMSYTFRQWSWLTSYIQQGVNYSFSESDSNLTEPDGSGWNYYLNLRNTIYLNKKKNLIGELSGSYNSKRYMQLLIIDPTYVVSVGLRYTLWNNKVNIGVNADNIFQSANSKAKGVYNGVEMRSNNTYWYRTFRLAISYNFGSEISAKRRNYSSTDLQRRF